MSLSDHNNQGRNVELVFDPENFNAGVSSGPLQHLTRLKVDAKNVVDPQSQDTWLFSKEGNTDTYTHQGGPADALTEFHTRESLVVDWNNRTAEYSLRQFIPVGGVE